MLVNQFLLPYGNDKIAAMGIAIKINLIALLILTGFAADGAQMLRLQVIMTPCVGLILLLTIVFQSFGKSTGSFLLSISRQGVIFVASFSIIKDQLDDLLEYRRSVANGNKNEFSRDSFETSFANSLKTDYCYIEDEIARYSDR